MEGSIPWEGAFASRVIANNLETLAPYTSALAGPGGFRAAPGGVLQGRFGFGSAITARFETLSKAPETSEASHPPANGQYANGTVVGGPAKLGGPQAHSRGRRGTVSITSPICDRKPRRRSLPNSKTFWRRRARRCRSALPRWVRRSGMR